MKIKPGFILSRWISALLLASSMLGIAHAQATRGMKYRFDLPPSAELVYAVKAKQKGVPVEGDSMVRWTISGNRFEVKSETRATLLGKILDTKSVGGLDSYGLAPSSFTEKRFRKSAITTSFDRASNSIRFGNSSPGYTMKGGEQDRSSALWQLIGVLRGAPGKFRPGSEWTMVVAGHSDAQPWTFKVLRAEKLRTPMGEINTVHVMRQLPADSKDQKLDIWLAPSLEWYPVRLRFAEADGDFIEQTLREARKKSP